MNNKPEGVNTAEFRAKLSIYNIGEMSENDFIAHIDGLLAQQREAGRREERSKMAATLTAESFLALPDAAKHEFFAIAVEDSTARKLSDERMTFLHSINKDADGYEYGIAKVKFSPSGQIESFLWSLSDNSDLDAAIAQQSPY